MNLSLSLPLIGESVSADPDGEELAEKYKKSLEAGENLLLAPTEGITHKRLDEISRDDEFSRLCREAMKKTEKAAGKYAAVCGLIAPSGIEEYNSGIFESLYFDYLEKITVLKNAGAKLILLKNAGSLGEMRAAVFASETADIPICIIMDVDEDGKNQNGTDYIASLITLQALGAAAFGISCIDGIYTLTELLGKAFPHAEIPLIASGNFSKLNEKEISGLIESGASVFLNSGDVMDKETISLIKHSGSKFEISTEKDSNAAAIDREAFFLFDDLVLSEPIDCSYGLAEDIIDLDDETVNSVCIELFTADDAALLADNASMTKLPVTVRTNDPVTLEAALRYFQGRLIIDTSCEIDYDILKQLAEKYGAILY